MEDKNSDVQENTTSIVPVENMKLEDTQMAEQLYNSAGLGPVVDAGLKDYNSHIQQENKLLNKVLGPRGSDIKGYGEAVAKRVAFAVYGLLNRQYGGKMGDLRSYIMALEDERNRANVRYDELMGKVVGILGSEYQSLRTDSNAFMEKLTSLMGDDVKASKINYGELAERLADIDGLRAQVKTLEQEKRKLTETYEAQIASLKDDHHVEVARMDLQVNELSDEKTTLTNDLEQSRDNYGDLKTGISALAADTPYENMGILLGKELHAYVLKDSKVPSIVIDGVGKFLDFEKYLGIAAERGATDVRHKIEQIISKSPSHKDG